MPFFWARRGLNKNERAVFELLFPQVDKRGLMMNAARDHPTYIDPIYGTYDTGDKVSWEEHMRRKRSGWESYVQKVLNTKDPTYQEIRLVRTESAARYADRQREIAKESVCGTGKVTRKLAARRDAWHCRCEDAAALINADGGMRPEEIPVWALAPLHPNCDCTDVPVMRPMKEVREELFDKYFGDTSAPIPEPLYEPHVKVNPVPEDYSYAAGGSVTVDNPFSTPVYRNPDYSKLTLKEANKRELEALGELTRKSGHEVMSIMTDDKKVISTLEGTTNKIDLSRAVTNILENSPTNSLSINQTHPSNQGFSPDDLWEVCKYESIKEFRLITADGKKYSANVGKGRRPKEGEYGAKIREITMALLNTPRYAKIKESDVMFERFIRERNYEIQKAFGWTIDENIKNADTE